MVLPGLSSIILADASRSADGTFEYAVAPTVEGKEEEGPVPACRLSLLKEHELKIVQKAQQRNYYTNSFCLIINKFSAIR